MEWLPVIFLIPYLILLLKIYKKLKNIKSFNASQEKTIFVSVVVACRNEEQNLLQLLDSLSSQCYASGLFEVLVVDDNSEDKTADIAINYKGLNNIRVISNSGNGKKKAVMSGVQAARGDLVVTTDADCTMGKQWLATIVSFYLENGCDLIIMPVRLPGGHGFLSSFQEIEFMSLQGVTAGAVEAGNAVMCNGANLAFRKQVFIRNLGKLHFAINTGDDIFLLHAVKKEAGSKISWLESADAMVTAASQPGIFRFIRQRKRWISKWKAYDDLTTIVLASVTFYAALAPLLLLAATAASSRFLLPLGVFLALKSIPDYLIISNTAARYGRRELLPWFIPSQLAYPFYVVTIAATGLFARSKGNVSYPSPRET